MNIFKTAVQSYDYPSFLHYAEDVIAKNEAHPEQSAGDKYAFYTKLNFQRMKRWNKTFTPDAALVSKLKAQPQQSWWVITEAWCGDSAQNLPVIAALADAAGIELQIVLRDQNEAVIDAYLTNGTKSIPILVAFDADDNQLFRWGPRPEGAQELMTEWKANPGGRDFDAFELEMHQWYHQHKGRETQEEIAALLA